MLDQTTKNKRTIGMSLFFIGSIIAISAAAKMPNEGDTYPTTVAVFVIALICGIVGNVLWHGTEKTKVLAELEEHKNDANSNPVMLLQNTIPAIEKLTEKAKTLKGMELCDEVDNVLDTCVHPFTDRRKTFQDILGQANGAEVLLVVAYAERMLNRVWSASSDGYHDEAVSCLADSLVNYKIALEKTNKYNA